MEKRMRGLKVGLMVGLMSWMASPAFARSIELKGAGTALWIFIIIGVPQYTVGVDVSKNTLDLYELATDHSSVIANDTGSIEQWLDRWAGPLRLAMEPTSTYHLAIAGAAQARGHQVYLVDAYRLSHYRAGIGQRVKADCQDARLLARYLQHEAAELRLWEPLPPAPQEFWRLLQRRATLVQTITRMQQSLTDPGSLQANVGDGGDLSARSVPQ